MAQPQGAKGSNFPLVNYLQGNGRKGMVWMDFDKDRQELSPLQPVISGIGRAHSFSCMLAQQDWRYAANITWQFLAKRGNLGPWKSFHILQCLFLSAF